MDLNLAPDIELAPAVKVLINIGGTFDIITGAWHIGKYGESVLNGGLGFVTGFVGPGNGFKSTSTHGVLLKGMSVVFDSCFRPENKKDRALKRMRSSKSDYDTEVNVQEARMAVFGAQFREFRNEDLFYHAKMLWRITDKTVMMGNTFFEKYKDFVNYKKQNRKKFEIDTPFLDRDKSVLKIILPTFSSIDSITDFQTETETDIQDDNELGSSERNILNARGGLFKTALLTELPGLTGGGYVYTGITAQLNTIMEMGGKPGGAQAPRKLQYLGNNQKTVGATNKFNYASTVAFHAKSAKPLVDDARMAEYPRPDAQKLTNDTDLNEVTLTILRNKNGPSGVDLVILVTQLEGIQFELTEFNNLRRNKRYGILGTGQWYTLDLYPSCVVQRTTVRKVLAENERFRRAVLISSEMQQMSVYMPGIWSMYGTDPATLYADIKKLGYDWDFLLTTRGSYRFNNDCHPVPFLSTLDLLKMRLGLYFPYWMTEDKKGIKPEFQYTFADEVYPHIEPEVFEKARLALLEENIERERKAAQNNNTTKTPS